MAPAAAPTPVPMSAPLPAPYPVPAPTAAPAPAPTAAPVIVPHPVVASASMLIPATPATILRFIALLLSLKSEPYVPAGRDLVTALPVLRRAASVHHEGALLLAG